MHQASLFPTFYETFSEQVLQLYIAPVRDETGLRLISTWSPGRMKYKSCEHSTLFDILMKFPSGHLFQLYLGKV